MVGSLASTQSGASTPTSRWPTTISISISRHVANQNFNFNSKSMSQQVANHAPLIFAMPQASEAYSSSLRTSKLVEFVDIFPTLVEATGFQPLDICPMMSNTSVLCTEGASLMPLLDDPELAQWKSSVFWQYPRREIFIQNPAFCKYKIFTNDSSCGLVTGEVISQTAIYGKSWATPFVLRSGGCYLLIMSRQPIVFRNNCMEKHQ